MKDAALISFRSLGATGKGFREFALTPFILINIIVLELNIKSSSINAFLLEKPSEFNIYSRIHRINTMIITEVKVITLCKSMGEV